MDFAELMADFDPGSNDFRESQIREYKKSGCRVEPITSAEADALRPIMADRCGFGKASILTYFTLINYFLLRPGAKIKGMRLLEEVRQKG